MTNSKASIKESQIESNIYKRIYRNMTLNVLVLKNRYICFLWNYFLSYNAYHSCTCENKNNIHLWTVQPLLFPKKNQCCYDLIKVFWSQLAQVQTKERTTVFDQLCVPPHPTLSDVKNNNRITTKKLFSFFFNLIPNLFIFLF